MIFRSFYNMCERKDAESMSICCLDRWYSWANFWNWYNKVILVIIFLRYNKRYFENNVSLSNKIKIIKCHATNLNSVGIEICSSTLFVHIVCSVKPTMVLYFLQGWSFPKGKETTNSLFDLKERATAIYRRKWYILFAQKV